MAVTNAQIVDFLLANPGMSDADIAAAMSLYGVDPSQVAEATGSDVAAIQERFDAVAAPEPVAEPVYEPVAEPVAPVAPVAPAVAGSVSTAQIVDFLTTNPNLTDAAIVKVMETYKVSPAELAKAVGLPEGTITARIAETVPNGQTITLGDTVVQPVYKVTGSGQDEQVGGIENVITYKATDNRAGGAYTQYTPTGEVEQTGTQQEVKSGLKEFAIGAGLLFGLPSILNAGTAATSTVGTVGADLTGTNLLTTSGTGAATSSVTGMGAGTGLTAGTSGLGLTATGTGLGTGLATGTGLGTGVLTGSGLGTSLLGAGTGLAGLTGTGVLTGSGLGTSLLGTTGAGALTGTGVLSGSTLGTQLLGTGAGTAATAGGLGNTVANLGTGALTTGLEGLSSGLTGLGTGLTSGLSGLGTSLGTGLTSGLTGLGTGIGTGLTNAALANLLSGGLATAGNLLQMQQSKEAAQIAQQRIDAETAAAKASAAFRPIGMTTRFGTSQFAVDPVTGQLTSAGYTLSPEAKNAQDRLVKLAESGLQQAEGAQAQFAPLQTGAQALFGLGNQYLAQSPQDVAQNYLNQQMALLQPGRELELANLQNKLQQQGRGGLSVAQGGAYGATTPELQALYNARAMQEAQLAAQAQQAGQQQVAFGAGLLGTGAQTMGQYYGGQQAAYAPYTNALGQVQNLESMAQQPLQMGASLGQQASAAGARMGELGLRGAGQSVALATGADATRSLGAQSLIAAGNPNAQFGQALGGLFGGGLQSIFSGTGLGSSGFGTGLAYGNQDLGLFL